MREVYERRPSPGPWVVPTGVVQREIDITTGKLATPWCPQNVRRWEVFSPNNVPTEYCPLHPGPNGPAAAQPPTPPSQDPGNKPPKRPPGPGR
jgi:hypothetical protein